MVSKEGLTVISFSKEFKWIRERRKYGKITGAYLTLGDKKSGEVKY